MLDFRLINIYELEHFINNEMDSNSQGILFCFGTSFISRIIMAKTRSSTYEIIPSHVALISKKQIYESTTEEVHVNDKTIPSGVRRWEILDFIKAEKNKLTKYVYIPHKFSFDKADSFVHLPYGKDTILDFLLKDGSDGDSRGLICSQYANKCINHPHKKACPTPADLFRMEKKKYNIEIVE